MADIDFKTLSLDELIEYCKNNNITYLNKQNKHYSHRTILTNIKHANGNANGNVNGNANGNDIDIKLNTIINACHNKLYNASISGFKALNDIMNIFILVLLEYVFKSKPASLNELIEIKKTNLFLNDNEIEEYKSYLLNINKFIQKFEIINNFSSIWRNYIIFLASLFPSLYDKDDTKFNCKEERIIVDVFKTIASLSKDINDDFINDLSIKHGNIYEYFIGYCGKSENSKAFGQFFTPKPFINAILNDCGFKEMIDNLEIENPTLYDPTMGSGGLLGLTYTTCKNKIKPNNIYGCEIEKDTMRYGESSILITTKEFNNNLIRCNTLDRNTNPYLRDNKKFDIIVSNPPFGTQTNYKDLIPDDYREDKKYKDDIYPIQTTGEKLFIQNIIYLMADGGICALILPDGELMTKNDTNKTIRKFILDNCKIIKIVEVDNGVFKHTNIKTKVLILKKEKTVDCDYEIDYMNINKKCETKLIKKFKLNEDYQFTIKTNNYNDININNPNIEIKTLGEVCEINQGKPLNKKDMINGIYDVIGGGKIIGKHNIKNRNDNEIVITRVGDLNINYINKAYYLTDNAFSLKSLDENYILTKYLYYIISNNKEYIKELYIGIAQKVISKSKLQLFEIPIPSLEQQEEVIKTIEDINNLIEYRRTLNENNKKEKKYLLDDIKRRYLKNHNNYEFGELFDLIKGTIQSSKVVEDPEGVTLVTGAKEFKQIKIISNISIISGYNLFISTNGNGDKIPIKYYDKECYYSCLMSLCKIKDEFKERINIKFIYYLLLQNQKYIEDNFQKGLANKSLDVKEFNKIKIPVPSLEQQEEFIREVEELNMTFEKIEKDNNYIIDNLENIKKEIFK